MLSKSSQIKRIYTIRFYLYEIPRRQNICLVLEIRLVVSFGRSQRLSGHVRRVSEMLAMFCFFMSSWLHGCVHSVKMYWVWHFFFCILLAICFFFFFYWSIVDLQCCVNFCCRAKWFSYTYIYSFSYSFPLWFIIGLFLNFWILFYFFIQQVLISYPFYTHQCIHVNPNLPTHHTTTPTPPWLSPLGVHTFVLYICASISALQTGSSVPFF